MNRCILVSLRSSCWSAFLVVCVFGGEASLTRMAHTREWHDHASEPMSAESLATTPNSLCHSEERSFKHPDGDSEWDRWGISPRVLNVHERFDRRLSITRIFGSGAEVAGRAFLELKGERRIDDARQFLDILGVDSLPNEPGPTPSRLSDDALRSVDGFAVSSELERRPRDLNPDRVAFTDSVTKERTRVYVIYGKSSADAMCRLLEAASMVFSAPLGQALPTCRIAKGPGDFCWLGWNRTNEGRSLFFPSDADVLFLRNGTAVLLLAEDSANHKSVIELAKKIDALLLRQRAEEKRGHVDAQQHTKSGG